MSCFVACWKRTLHQSLAAINILEANSGLEMSEERRPLRQFREHPRRSFEPGRSIWPHHFEKSRKHSNESRSSVLLKLKPGPDNDAQLEVSSGGPVDGSHTRWHGIALNPWMRTAGRTRTRRAFAAAELDERQRQRDSSPWLPPARTTSPLLSLASIAPDWRSRSPFLRRTFSLRHASHCGVLRLSASSREHPPEGTVPSPALPTIVPLAAPCSLLALAPPIACAFSAATLRRARTSSHESSGRRSTVTDARDLPRKVTASLRARPANVLLATLCSLSEFASHVAYALSATTPRRARVSLPGPRKCPVITQFGSTDTFGLHRSLTARPGHKPSRKYSQFKRQSKSFLERKDISSRWRDTQPTQRTRAKRRNHIAGYESNGTLRLGFGEASRFLISIF